ncbi:hypothetical protein QUF76_11970 [Desulfobacterales bacterium HSG16]|nr:hypothetical protein [Desulfobacterales bacterium HSG16]
MPEFTKSQKARQAIREFKTITEALAVRGFYRPSGKFGKELEDCLKILSPEIYGSMNDTRISELKGLEYVIDRLPRGIEQCTRIILTEEDPLDDTPFKKMEPLKRRRASYRICKDEICFIISRGLSEIYDIITHMTFLNIEAKKIRSRMKDPLGNPTGEWARLEKFVKQPDKTDGLSAAIWNLSIVLGRSYKETCETYEYLEKNKEKYKSNNGLFSLIYELGMRVENESASKQNALMIYFTPSLMKIIGHQKYGKMWANDIKKKLFDLNLHNRPVHIISANLHSVVNTLYGYAAVKNEYEEKKAHDLYDFFYKIKGMKENIAQFAFQHGLFLVPDRSGTNIDCQIIDTSKLEPIELHPDIKLDFSSEKAKQPVILVMDYAFGTQAFELMENLLKPSLKDNAADFISSGSISIMGKAGILPGKKGDIMLATGHVFEGSAENYIFENDFEEKDFDNTADIYTGPMITVLGTSLQNRDVLKRLQTDWQTVGLEMEGGYYQRAISAAAIKGHIKPGVRLRYAYYASDNPLMTGNTLAAGSMGKEGVKPTYMITKAILEKICLSLT